MIHQGAQRPAQPIRHRRRESPFFARQNIPRQQIRDGILEGRLAILRELVTQRQSQRKIDQFVILKR